jgi:hypothetical protein
MDSGELIVKPDEEIFSPHYPLSIINYPLLYEAHLFYIGRERPGCAIIAGKRVAST